MRLADTATQPGKPNPRLAPNDMTARAPFTEAALRRAITAAEKKGYRIGGIKPDGTVLVYSGDSRPDQLSLAPAVAQTEEDTSWADR